MSDPICFGISAFDSNSMKSSNPYSGIYEAKTARTLDLNGGNPSCNQGGVLVLQRRFSNVLVEQTNTSPTLKAAMGCGGNNIPIVLASFEGNGQRPSHKGSGLSIGDGKMFTLNSTEVHGAIYELPENDRSADGE